MLQQLKYLGRPPEGNGTQQLADASVSGCSPLPAAAGAPAAGCLSQPFTLAGNSAAFYCSAATRSTFRGGPGKGHLLRSQVCKCPFGKYIQLSVTCEDLKQGKRRACRVYGHWSRASGYSRCQNSPRLSPLSRHARLQALSCEIALSSPLC